MSRSRVASNDVRYDARRVRPRRGDAGRRFQRARGLADDRRGGARGAAQSRGVDAHAGIPPDSHRRVARAMPASIACGSRCTGPAARTARCRALLEWLGMPYTGSGVMASALAMDKVRSKHLFARRACRRPTFAVVARGGRFRPRRRARPAADRQAGRAGLERRHDARSSKPLRCARPSNSRASYDAVVLAERCIVGDEYTAARAAGRGCCRSIRIETPRVFYDYRAKYESRRTRYVCPGGSRRDAVEQRYRRARDARAFDANSAAAAGAASTSCWTRTAAAGARSQHRARHDQSQPGADGGARGAASTSTSWCWRILETSVARPAGVARMAMEVSSMARTQAKRKRKQREGDADRCGSRRPVSWAPSRSPAPRHRRSRRTRASTRLLDRPIDRSRSAGPFQRVSPLQIEEAISDELGAGFLGADLDACRQIVRPCRGSIRPTSRGAGRHRSRSSSPSRCRPRAGA